jgi:hypothetical protein
VAGAIAVGVRVGVFAVFADAFAVVIFIAGTAGIGIILVSGLAFKSWLEIAGKGVIDGPFIVNQEGVKRDVWVIPTNRVIDSESDVAVVERKVVYEDQLEGMAL